jgi:hypothetical protein
MSERLDIVENKHISISIKKEEKLDNLIANAVNKALKQVFNEKSAKTIEIFIETHSHLTLNEIAERPKPFATYLDKLLSSATPAIKKLILKNLYSKLEMEFKEKKNYGFSDYIEEMKKSIKTMNRTDQSELEREF